MERKISSVQAISILADVSEAEMNGDYSRAYQLLSVFWNDFRIRPNTTELSDDLVAEVFLRCGSIAGYLGRSRQISEAQDVSRNLLSEAKQKFLQLQLEVKVAECDNYLALTYERVGDVRNARDFLNSAFSRDIPVNHPTRLYSHIIDAMLNLAEKNYENVIQSSILLENIFQTCSNKIYQDCFYNHYGLALKNLGKSDEALEKFLTARQFFFEAGHHQYCGALENNIARLYTVSGKFKEAHNFAGKAENTFKLVGDFCRQGYSLDTQASIFLAEEKYEEALEYAERGIRFLQNGENLMFLLETLKTKIKTLTYLNQHSEALECVAKAGQVAKQIDAATETKFFAEIDLFLAEHSQPSLLL